MPKVRVDFTGVEAFVKCAVGQHIAKLIEAEEKVSSSGNDMIAVTFEVTNGESKGARLYDNFVLTEKSLWKLKGFLTTVGMKADGKVSLDLDKLVGKTCIIEVGEEEYDGRMKSKITDYKKVEVPVTKPKNPTDSPALETADDDEWDEAE